jgi:glycosyltransferase involved in cell wall biosynthesis
MDPALSVVIPAYNEERGIGAAIRETDAYFSRLGIPYEILAVDDGSRDRTVSEIERLIPEIPRLKLLRHAENQGKGAAVRTGIGAASGNWTLFLDADLATHPAQFDRFLPHLETSDIVIGSRRAEGARIAISQPWHRDSAGQIFNAAVRTYLDLPYRDTQCGFKAFHARTKPLFAELVSSGWAFDTEVLRRARRLGLRIAECPVVWRHQPESRVSIWDAFAIAAELRRIRRATR